MIKTVFMIMSVLLGSCAPQCNVERYIPSLPEIVVEVRELPTGHVLGIGERLAERPELVTAACAQLAQYLATHAAPARSVRFYAMRYPVRLDIPGRPTQWVHSYRVPTTGPIVLGWWFDERGAFVLGDMDHEIDRFVRGVDDDGRPIW